MPLFVWLEGLRGPEPQIWYSEQTTGEGKLKDKNILAQHKITEAEVKEGFNALINRYAAPST